MAGFIVRRLLTLVPLLVLISFAVFSFVLLIPGDPARAIAGGLNAPEEQVEAIRAELGLDDPVLVQYGRWLGGAVTGDLGTSLVSHRSVWDEITSRFPVTLSVALGAVVFSILVGVPAGILAGTRPRSLVDRVVTFGTSVGVAVPDFFLATALVVVLAVESGLLPAIGYIPFGESPTEWARHLVMAWVALGVSASASLARQVRGAMVDVLSQEYIRTARAKGLSERSVVFKHALKNAATPALTILGLQFAYLLGGTVIIESIFSLPGLGRFLLDAIVSTDLPVIQGVVLVVAVGFVFVNLIVDVLYGVVNPKVRAE